MLYVIVTLILFAIIFAIFGRFIVGRFSSRVSLINLSLYTACFFITSEWLIEFGGLVIAPVYDLLMVCFAIIWGNLIYQKKLYRSRLIMTLLLCFGGYYIWRLFAQFYHKGFSLQVIWSWYRRDLVVLVFLLAGIVLAFRPKKVQRNAYMFLVTSYLIVALIGITQSVSRGRLFVNLQNQRYVGVLTKLPSNSANIDRYDNFERGQRLGSGGGFFYDGIFRASGTQPGGSTFAPVMVTGLCLCLGGWLVKERHDKQVKRLLSLTLPVLTLALILTFTRTAWVSFAFAALWAWLHWFTAKRRATVLLIITFGAIIIAPTTLVASMSSTNTSRFETIISRFADLTNPLEADTFQWRVRTWTYAWNNIEESPIFGSNKRLFLAEIHQGQYNLRQTDTTTPHNEYLRSFYEGGIPLGTLYIFTHVWLYRLTTRSRRSVMRDSMFATWVISANLTLLALLINGIGYNWLSGINLQGIFWLLSAIAVGHLQRQRQTMTTVAPINENQVSFAS